MFCLSAEPKNLWHYAQSVSICFIISENKMRSDIIIIEVKFIKYIFSN